MLAGIGAFFLGVWQMIRPRAVSMPEYQSADAPAEFSPPSFAAQTVTAKPVEPEGLDVLARTIWGEARGDGTAGMEAVAAVVMNRVRSRRYPSTVEKVCLQPYQFSAWLPGDPNRQKMLDVTLADPLFKQARGIAALAISGQLRDPTGGALHYYADYIKPPYWAAGATVSARIGTHVFLVGVA